MTTIALLVEKTTTIIIPNVIIPHARKPSIITQQTKITTTIIIAIAILSHVGKVPSQLDHIHLFGFVGLRLERHNLDYNLMQTFDSVKER
jgi:hypothetical protein